MLRIGYTRLWCSENFDFRILTDSFRRSSMPDFLLIRGPDFGDTYIHPLQEVEHDS